MNRKLCWSWPILILGLACALPARSETGESAAPAEDREGASLKRGDAYFHLMKARLAAGRGRPAEAIHELKEAIDLAPDSSELLAEGATLLAGAGKRDEAEKMARRALEMDPRQPQAMRTLADLLAMRALSASPDTAARIEAIRLYEKLADSPQADAQVLQLLTNLKLLNEDLSGAVETARKFATRRPGDQGTARLLTQLLLQQGKPEDALRVLLDFLATSPDSTDLVPVTADLAGRTGRWSDVEPVARAIVAANPDNTGARVLLAECLLRLGKPEAALPVLEQALETMQDAKTWEESIRSFLGEAYLRLDRQNEAVKQLEAALELGKGDSLVRLHLASAYGSIGRLADASALAKGLAGDYPGNPAILVVLGECLAQQGMVDSAVEAFAAAREGIDGEGETMVARRDEIRLRIAALYLGRHNYKSAEEAIAGLERPDSPDALKLRARLALSTGKTRDARQLAHKLKGKEDQGVAVLLEAESVLREGHLAKAEEKFREAIGSLGAEAADQVAAIYREAGRDDLGEPFLREWVQREPKNVVAQFALGRYLERSGRFAEAYTVLEQVVDLDPKNGDALNYLGYSLADRNERLDEALALVRRALDVEQWNGAFLDSLGWVYFRLGQFDKARDPLERAAREYPRDPTVLEHLGDCYDKLGDRDGAERAWQRALEADPQNADALRGKILHEKETGVKSGRERTSVAEPDPPKSPDPR